MAHEALFEMLARDVQQHRLRPLDVGFARFLAERDSRALPTLLWLAALLSRQLADGHLCLDLDDLDALADEQAWSSAWRKLMHAAGDRHAALSASSLLA
ncbi:MAG: exodeoxyribonuclease V subunit alpha, partial [Rhodanobacter sp.]